MKLVDRYECTRWMMRLLRSVLLFLVCSLIALGPSFGEYETWARSRKSILQKKDAGPAGKVAEIPEVEEEREDEDEPFALIAEKNLFSPERKEFQQPIIEPPKEVREGKKPIARPKVTLYGVTIAGDYQSATLSVAGRALRKGERDSMTLLPGERVGEYKLARILADRISLEALDDSFEVFLYDSGSPKKREYAKTENKPATVTSALTGTPSPGAGDRILRPGMPGAATTPAGPAGARPEPQPPAPVIRGPLSPRGSPGTTAVPAGSVTQGTEPQAPRPLPPEPTPRFWGDRFLRD